MTMIMMTDNLAMKNTMSYLQIPICTQPAITCPKLATVTLEQGVKYAQS